MSVPELLPLFPLGAVLLPGMDLPLQIFEPRYRQLMQDQRGVDPIFGVVLIRAGREVIDHPEVRQIGTAATLMADRADPDGRTSILVRGTRRFRTLETNWSRDYLTGYIEWLPEEEGNATACEALATQATDQWGQLVRRLAGMISRSDDVSDMVETLIARLPENPNDRCYQILGQLPIPAGTRQHYLEIATTEDRLTSVVELLRNERRLISALSGAPLLNYTSTQPANLN